MLGAEILRVVCSVFIMICVLSGLLVYEVVVHDGLFVNSLNINWRGIEGLLLKL
jgi:hypothetical protein